MDDKKQTNFQGFLNNNKPDINSKRKKSGQFCSLWGFTSRLHGERRRQERCRLFQMENCGEICTLARAAFPELAVFVAMPGECFSLHHWVKQRKGENLRFVWINTHTSKHNLSCSDFICKTQEEPS